MTPETINENKKQVVIFDLDGTLAESKQPLDFEMASLLADLLTETKVAVISGGTFGQFEKQFVARLPLNPRLYSNLFLFPASGTAFYKYDNAWTRVYSEEIAPDAKERIKAALLQVESQLGLAEPTIYGEKIEDRGSQVTYSALGQQAPLEAKKIWDQDQEKRKKMTGLLTPMLPEFTVTIGGLTSVDITQKGVDKAYGVQKIEEVLGVPIAGMIFVGDKLDPGGNDFAVKRTGIDTFAVGTVDDTKKFIKEFIENLKD